MKFDLEVVERLARRAFVLTTRIIDDANHRPDEEEGDPKVGGHPAACSSAIHLISTLRFAVAGPLDTYAHKPHASPADHSINFLLGLFREPHGRRWLDLPEAQALMTRLRQFSFRGEPVFQSYHAESDPDTFGYFPTGSVGIPPVVSLYTALAWRYARDHGHEVPDDVHHWSLIGDSEFREGSLLEAMPEAAEREIHEITWIVDYNRQNLDGERVLNERGLHGRDSERMVRVAQANGWDAFEVRHGRRRLEAFRAPDGDRLRDVLEAELSDFELQALLFRRDGALTRERLVARDPKLEQVLSHYDDAAVQLLVEDLGGHDVHVLAEALGKARASRAPTLLVVHTVKGWGLSSFASPGNHSDLPPRNEVAEFVRSEGLDPDHPYQRFAEGTPEAALLDARGSEYRRAIEGVWELHDRNAAALSQALEKAGPLPERVGVDLRLTPVVFTQYVWGQALAKLIRIGTFGELQRRGMEVREPTSDEKRWNPTAEYLLTMAPDVGTSTNINPAMDEKVYGPPPEENYERTLGLKERRRPALAPHEEPYTRHVRFEIAEANCMTAAGAFGKVGDQLGIPLFPVMTVYDFFIKRAYDQLYYNLYWGSRFLLVGTPSGVSLAPEGAQHSWKSDIQMPNLITWEPMFGIEVDWIVAETLRRRFTGDDAGRTGVLLRAVTRGLHQKEMLTRLRRHRRFKQDGSVLLRPDAVELEGGEREAEVEPRPDEEILAAVRNDALEGAYYLVDYRGYAGYEPGDNVVHLFVMGALGPEALHASDLLLARGIYANVIAVTSPDLLAGNLAHENGYRHLRETLEINATLHVTRKRRNGHVRYDLQTRADLVEATAGRIPLVSVADGEIGLLDNLGSIVGVHHDALGVRKPSKSGRPSDVYRLHHLDPESIARAAMRLLGESALDEVRVSRGLLEEVSERPVSARPAGWEATEEKLPH